MSLMIGNELNISAAGNTEIPIILTLEEKGFQVMSSENGRLWTAVGKDNIYNGESPSGLLASVEMHSFRGDAWKATDKGNERCMSQYPGLS